MNIHSIYAPFLLCFRRSRMRILYDRLGLQENCRVLDIGGSRVFWEIASRHARPLPWVTIINLRTDSEARSNPRLSWIVADAKALPFRDLVFDVAIANSLIEHLGDRAAQMRFAEEIRRVASRYFVQTPNLLFPIEPHFLTPFIHWLPCSWRRKMLRNWTLWGLIVRPSQRECAEKTAEIKLLSRKDMRSLFPECQILAERFLGIPKSLIAVFSRYANWRNCGQDEVSAK